MESEEPKITFESIMRNWNARYNYGAKAQAQQSHKVRALNATMRNPETPAGTYPVFEAYLGVDVIEKATRLKRERKQKRKAFWKKTALWVAIGVPVSLIVALLVIGAINFTSSVKQEQLTAPSIAANAKSYEEDAGALFAMNSLMATVLEAKFLKADTEPSLAGYAFRRAVIALLIALTKRGDAMISERISELAREQEERRKTEGA